MVFCVSTKPPPTLFTPWGQQGRRHPQLQGANLWCVYVCLWQMTNKAASSRKKRRKGKIRWCEHINVWTSLIRWRSPAAEPWVLIHHGHVAVAGITRSCNQRMWKLPNVRWQNVELLELQLCKQVQPSNIFLLPHVKVCSAGVGRGPRLRRRDLTSVHTVRRRIMIVELILVRQRVKNKPDSENICNQDSVECLCKCLWVIIKE